MPNPTPLNSLSQRLAAFDQVEDRRNTTCAADLLTIVTDLQRIEQVTPPDQLGTVEQLRARYQRVVIDMVAQLRQECTTFANNSNLPTDLTQIDSFEQSLIEYRRKLQILFQLAPDLQGERECTRIETHFSTLTDRIDTARTIASAEKSIRELIHQSKELDSLYGQDAVQFAKDARDSAKALVDREVAQTIEERTRVYRLQSEAADHYDNIRKRHEIPVTKQEAGQLVEQIIEFINLAARDPQARVTYYEDTNVSALARIFPVGTARDIAKDRLSVLIWFNKITEYTRSARVLLGEHKPREAYAALERWRDLPGLNDQRLGMTLDEGSEAMIAEVKLAIQPELTKLEQAEEYLRNAKRELSAVKAYEHWLHAQKIYPHITGLDELDSLIKTRAIAEFQQSNKNTEKYIQKEEWEDAERCLLSSSELLQTIPHVFDEDSKVSHSRLQRTLQAVLDIIHPPSPLSPTQQLNLFRLLREKYEYSYWLQWTRLNSRLRGLETRGNVQDLLDRCKDACKRDASSSVLDQLGQETDELINYPPADIADDLLREIKRADMRIKAWQGFVRVRDELAKLDPTEPAGGENQGLQANAPDLTVVRKGIEDAKGDAQAAEAMRQLGLEAKYNGLTRNDTEALEALRRCEQQVANSDLTLKDAERLRNEINDWLSKPTSYRQRYHELRRRLGNNALTIAKDEVERLIQKTRPYYRKLDSESIKRWVRLISGFNLPPSQQGDEFLDLVKVPQRIAGIYEREQQANDATSWEGVREQWRKATDLAHEGGDRSVEDYCKKRADDAYCQSVLAEIGSWRRQLSPEREQRIEEFTHDPILQHNAHIWRTYAELLLIRVQREIRDSRGDQVDLAALDRVRSALERAQRLPLGEFLPATPASRSPEQLLQEQKEWQQATHAFAGIASALATTDRRITVKDCERARHMYDEQRQTLHETTELLSLLEQVWNRHTRIAQGTFDPLTKDRNLFEQLDALLALMLLFPEKEDFSQRLYGQITTAVLRFRQDVKEICDDPTAGNFLQRRATSGNANLADQQVLDEQCREVESLPQRLDTIRCAIKHVPDHHITMGGLQHLAFDDEERSIHDWYTQLNKCRNALTQALQMAQSALLMPDQFERVYFILRQPNNRGTTNLPQVPEMFKDRGHPTYRWHVNEVQGLHKRLKRQQQLISEIQWSLRHEHVSTIQQLPNPSTVNDPTERALIAELRNELERTERPTLPLEVTLRRIRVLTEEDPKDSCGVQEAFKYEDPDDDQRTYRTITSVRPVLERKLVQIRAIYDYLAQISTIPHLGDLQCPGIVDWTSEKQRLQVWRDRAPYEFKAIYKLCREIRIGDVNALCHVGDPPVERWALQRTIKALDQSTFVEGINKRLAQAGYATVSIGRLCKLAEAMDQKRQEQVTQLQAYVRESADFESDISKRVANFSYALDQFMATYNAIMQQPAGKFKPREAEAYFATLREMKAICPRWPDLLRYEENVAQRHGLRPLS